MAKALALTPETFRAPQVTPAAATPARSPVVQAAPSPNTTGKSVPLQIRISAKEAKAIRVAAAEAEQTISDFMLACFHACMKKEAEKRA